MLNQNYDLYYKSNSGVDVVLAGIATHYVPLEKLNDVTEQLVSDNSNIDSILQNYDKKHVTQKFSLDDQMPLINECFSAPSVEEIISRSDRF